MVTPSNGESRAPTDGVPLGFGFDDPDDAWLREIRTAEAPLPPPSLGRYVDLEEVHRGGQGVVYRGRDRDSQRDVAVKRLLAGSLATPSMRRRFERELEIVWTLDHPNIATVCGMDEIDGSPILAMEWIDGVEISRWARGGGTTPRPVRTIVEVFVKVCDAVAYAHRRGVIHRDLKPSNILVEESGEPFVVDFGLAKIIEPAGAPADPLSVTQQFVGTLAYASPEQLGAKPHDVDVRSDVYSLGVILYELLTGRLPYDLGDGLAGATATITHAAPLRPSTLVEIHRDLEAIVLAALAKERELRYQSAEALADDLRAWLEGRSVTARVPGPIARFARAVRRNRAVSALAAAIFAVVVIAAVVSGALAVRHARQRDLATAAGDEALVQAERARAVNAFLQEMLASADPMRERDVTVRELLDTAAMRLDDQTAAVEAAVRQIIGVTYHSLGEYDLARVHLERALALARAAHPANARDVASAANELGHLMTSLGRYAEAEAILDEALDSYRALGEQSGVAAEVATVLNNRAKAMWMTGRYADSEPLWREALAIRQRAFGLDDALTLSSLHNLAGCLHAQGELAAAEPLYREALAGKRRLLGDDHPDIGDGLHSLAVLLRDTGRYDESTLLFRDALETKRRALGPDHPNVAFTTSAMGLLLLETGDVEGAQRLFREALAIYDLSVDRDHPRRADALAGLGRALATAGDPEAASVLREALEMQRKRLGDEHPSTIATRDALSAIVTSDR